MDVNDAQVVNVDSSNDAVVTVSTAMQSASTSASNSNSSTDTGTRTTITTRRGVCCGIHLLSVTTVTIGLCGGRLLLHPHRTMLQEQPPQQEMNDDGGDGSAQHHARSC
jgi:hypothetical protein